jgi:acetyl-CoA synthetase
MHAVVFAGFSAEALRTRIQHVQARVVITVDSVSRNGRVVPLKENVDEVKEFYFAYNKHKNSN